MNFLINILRQELKTKKDARSIKWNGIPYNISKHPMIDAPKKPLSDNAPTLWDK